MPLLSILLNKLLEAKLKHMEEMKHKFRMQFFFYAPLQPSSKPHAPLESRNGIKAGDLKTRDIIRISFNSPVCYTNCINTSRNNLKWQFQGLYTHIQHKRKGEKKSQPLKGNKKLSLGASSSYPILLYTSCYPTLLYIRSTLNESDSSN